MSHLANSGEQDSVSWMHSKLLSLIDYGQRRVRNIEQLIGREEGFIEPGYGEPS